MSQETTDDYDYNKLPILSSYMKYTLCNTHMMTSITAFKTREYRELFWMVIFSSTIHVPYEVKM